MTQRDNLDKVMLNLLDELSKDLWNEYVGIDLGTAIGETDEGILVYKYKGKNVSELSTTFQRPSDNKWINVPTVHNGKIYTDIQIQDMYRDRLITETSIHNSEPEATKAADERSNNIQIQLFKDEKKKEEFPTKGYWDAYAREKQGGQGNIGQQLSDHPNLFGVPFPLLGPQIDLNTPEGLMDLALGFVAGGRITRFLPGKYPGFMKGVVKGGGETTLLRQSKLIPVEEQQKIDKFLREGFETELKDVATLQNFDETVSKLVLKYMWRNKSLLHPKITYPGQRIDKTLRASGKRDFLDTKALLEEAFEPELNKVSIYSLLGEYEQMVMKNPLIKRNAALDALYLFGEIIEKVGTKLKVPKPIIWQMISPIQKKLWFEDLFAAVPLSLTMDPETLNQKTPEEHPEKTVYNSLKQVQTHWNNAPTIRHFLSNFVQPEEIQDTADRLSTITGIMGLAKTSTLPKNLAMDNNALYRITKNLFRGVPNWDKMKGIFGDQDSRNKINYWLTKSIPHAGGEPLPEVPITELFPTEVVTQVTNYVKDNNAFKMGNLFQPGMGEELANRMKPDVQPPVDKIEQSTRDFLKSREIRGVNQDPKDSLDSLLRGKNGGLNGS